MPADYGIDKVPGYWIFVTVKYIVVVTCDMPDLLPIMVSFIKLLLQTLYKREGQRYFHKAARRET